MESTPFTVTLLGARPPGLTDLLAETGIAAADTDPTSVVVLGTVGEPDRLLTHHLVRRHRRHLLLRYLDDRIVLGPYVVPGTTACLGCVDAHRDEVDPRPVPRPVGLPRPVDVTTRGGMPTAVTALAAAWIACEIERIRADQRPITWSTTVELTNDLASITAIEWLRHPACTCAWFTCADTPVPPDSVSRDTMAG